PVYIPPPARLGPTYPLSLHDALPIYVLAAPGHQHVAGVQAVVQQRVAVAIGGRLQQWLAPGVEHAQFHARGQPLLKSATDGNGKDRKSTRLNSSHVKISYSNFGLKTI